MYRILGWGITRRIDAHDLPAEWLTDDAYAERRRQCGLPAETTFQTKPALALEMLTAVVQSQALRCRWVVADEAFGNNPDFLDGVAGLGLWYFAEVPRSTRVWEERPATHIPPRRGRGRRPPRERLVAGAPEAPTVLKVDQRAHLNRNLRFGNNSFVSNALQGSLAHYPQHAR